MADGIAMLIRASFQDDGFPTYTSIIEKAVSKKKEETLESVKNKILAKLRAGEE